MMSIRSYRCLQAIVAFLVLSGVTLGESSLEPPTFGAAREIPLYSGVAPGSEKWDYAEVTTQGKSGPQLRNVVRPTLLYFPAERPCGTAMIVAPGGGNRMLMMSYEGVDVARKLNTFGVDAFVLKYRLNYTGAGFDGKEPTTTGPQAGQNVRELAGLDGCQAVALLRTRADEFRIDPNRIGLIGFSAGGGPIRAAMANEPASRPNFAALIYGAGSRDGVLKFPEVKPPLFLAVSADDSAYQSTLDTFIGWRNANAPVELHIFQMGAHGFVNKGGGADHFMDRVAEWMQVNGFLSESKPK